MDDATLAIGFDFGLYHIGTAVGQNITQKATPLHSIDAKKGRPDWDAVDRLIDQWHPDYLVVGMPYQEDGSHQAMSRAALKFLKALEARYPTCQVFEQDERYTTQLAKTELVEEGGSKALTKSNIDCKAAQLILGEWLQTHNPV